MESSPEFLALLEFVHCEYLSGRQIAEFVELISGTELNLKMYQNIWSRLIHSQRRSTRFVPSDFDTLDRIVANLTRECGGHVHDHHVVTGRSSAPINCEPYCAAKNVVDLQVVPFSVHAAALTRLSLITATIGFALTSGRGQSFQLTT
jgi:hypothetical protein